MMLASQIAAILRPFAGLIRSEGIAAEQNAKTEADACWPR